MNKDLGGHSTSKLTAAIRKLQGKQSPMITANGFESKSDVQAADCILNDVDGLEDGQFRGDLACL